MVDGPNAGRAVVQKTCFFWDLDEENGNGYAFHNLSAFTPTTLRATAPGYKPAEIHVTGASSYSYSTDFLLTKEP